MCPTARWLTLLSILVAGAAWAADTSAGKPLSFPAILANELNREFGALKAKADPPPYYMAYEATEEQTDSASATLGALVQDNHAHSRGVDTTIRVGSAKFDNYHPLKGSRGQFTTFTILSTDDNANEISRQLWGETDRVYRLASRRLLQLKTDEQLLAEQSTNDADFSAEPRETYSQLPELYSYDRNAWAQRVRTWSAEFKNHPQVMGSEVTFRAQHEIRTFVNTEGTSIQRGPGGCGVRARRPLGPILRHEHHEECVAGRIGDVFSGHFGEARLRVVAGEESRINTIKNGPPCPATEEVALAFPERADADPCALEPGDHGERLDPPAAFSPGFAKPVRACLEGQRHDRREPVLHKIAEELPFRPPFGKGLPRKGAQPLADALGGEPFKHIEVALECPVDLGRRQRSKAWFHGDGSGPTIRPRGERRKPFVRARTPRHVAASSSTAGTCRSQSDSARPRGQ